MCTTLSDSCEPSVDDLNALVHNRFDLLLLVGVNRSQPEQLRLRANRLHHLFAGRLAEDEQVEQRIE